VTARTRTLADTWLLLSGGVGGAKLALGLDRLLPRGALTVIANTGDDFNHLGLAISPDLDTLMYTLADAVSPETGWGCRDETWNFMAALERLGGKTWFRLGDRDLATHVERTRRLAAGETLSKITQDLCERLGLGSRIIPMSDARVETRVATADGVLSFQDYFVRRHAQPAVAGLHYAGARDAAPPADALEALGDSRLRAIFIAPSNPWLSIDPILAVPALRDALRETRVPVVAVSPIVGGAALKGPTAKIMGEFGLPVTSGSIARHYREYLDGLILDTADAGEIAAIEEPGLAAVAAPTVMRSLDDKVSLARIAIEFAATLHKN